jgi:hypothetical protein
MPCNRFLAMYLTKESANWEEFFQSLGPVPVCQALRVGARTDLVQHVQHSGEDALILEIVLVEVAQLRARAQGIDDGQGLFSLDDVAGRRLARHSGIAPDAEDIIRHLEGEAQVVAKVAIVRHDLGFATCQQGAELGRAAKEGGRLARYHLQVLCLTHLGPLLKADVQVLAVDQGQAGTVQDLPRCQHLGRGHAPLGQAGHRHVSQCKQAVADVERLGNAPHFP